MLTPQEVQQDLFIDLEGESVEEALQKIYDFLGTCHSTQVHDRIKNKILKILNRPNGAVAADFHTICEDLEKITPRGYRFGTNIPTHRYAVYRFWSRYS